METTKNFSKNDLDKFNKKIDKTYNKKNSLEKKYDIPNLNTYLNKNEIDSLIQLEKNATRASKFNYNKKDILNLSLKEFIENWGNNNLEIFSDLVKFLGSMSNYKGYFSDIDETGNWTNGIYVIIKDFLDIFKRDLRSIYFGVTLILFSLLLHFIQITS